MLAHRSRGTIVAPRTVRILLSSGRRIWAVLSEGTVAFYLSQKPADSCFDLPKLQTTGPMQEGVKERGSLTGAIKGRLHHRSAHGRKAGPRVSLYIGWGDRLQHGQRLTTPSAIDKELIRGAFIVMHGLQGPIEKPSAPKVAEGPPEHLVLVVGQLPRHGVGSQKDLLSHREIASP